MEFVSEVIVDKEEVPHNCISKIDNNFLSCPVYKNFERV